MFLIIAMLAGCCFQVARETGMASGQAGFRPLVSRRGGTQSGHSASCSLSPLKNACATLTLIRIASCPSWRRHFHLQLHHADARTRSKARTGSSLDDDAGEGDRDSEMRQLEHWQLQRV